MADLPFAIKALSNGGGAGPLRNALPEFKERGLDDPLRDLTERGDT